MITKTKDGYMFKCPDCGRDRVYHWHYLALKAMNKKTSCKSCVHKGNRHYLYGQKLPDEIKEKMALPKRGRKLSNSHRKCLSIAQKRRYSNPKESLITSQKVKFAMHKPDIREKHIKALAESKYLGKSVDKGQLKLLEKWNSLGFKFEPNFQIHNNFDLFYIDGYDPINNIVLEYDSKYHLKSYQKEKDLIRQNKIINILKPKKFWRYDAVNKQFRNVLERNG